jgi:hypothetical protein
MRCVRDSLTWHRARAGCAIGVNDMRNPLRPVLRALPFLPEVRFLSTLRSSRRHMDW